MTVYLVGAGPGDPDLLTRRGAHLLARADAVVVDRLVDPRVLDEVPESAVVHYVGKVPFDATATTSQSKINDLLVELGRRFACVVRLKGGDPFLFGRGGEEIAALESAGVTVEIVPGVTSALGVPALAGIPVTHRGLSRSVAVVTGHDPAEVDTVTADTIVLLMAVATRKEIAARLMANGRDPLTPVAVLERVSGADERRQVVTLGNLGATEVASPAVIVVGSVALLMRELASDPATRTGHPVEA